MTDAQLDLLWHQHHSHLSIDQYRRQLRTSRHADGSGATAYTIWNRVMRSDPQDPIWPIATGSCLSNGHASMLLWSVLHLTKDYGGETLTTRSWDTLGNA